MSENQRKNNQNQNKRNNQQLRQQPQIQIVIPYSPLNSNDSQERLSLNYEQKILAHKIGNILQQKLEDYNKKIIKISLLTFVAGIAVLLLSFTLGSSFRKFTQNINFNREKIFIQADQQNIVSQNLTKDDNNSYKFSSINSNVNQYSFGCRFYRQFRQNQKNVGKLFHQTDNYFINITKLLPQADKSWQSVRKEDENKKIYVLTPKDFNKIIGQIDFQKIKKDMINEVAYQILQFQKDSSISMIQPLLKYQNFKDDKEIENYLKNLKQINPKNHASEDQLFQLAIQMSIDPNNRSTLEAEYYSVNKRYKIEQLQRELPMCIIGTEYQLFSGNRYQKFFQTVDRLNYTNYHVVYIDKNSPDGSAYKIYDYVRNSNFKIKNRMKIVQTLQPVGGLVNILIWIQKLCNPNQIVVNIDLENYVVGTQLLKILNKMYQDESTWYVYSRYMGYDLSQKQYSIGISSKQFQINTSDYRKFGINMISHLKTYRQKLIKTLPIYQFFDFYFDQTTGIGWPSFPILNDMPLIYSLFQLAGSDRVKFIPDFTYIQPAPKLTNQCDLLHQQLDSARWLYKTPLKRLNSLDQEVQMIQDYRVSKEISDYIVETSRKVITLKCH